jgi:hypothetical protein
MHIDASEQKKNHKVFNSWNADSERFSPGFQDSHNTYCYYCSYIAEVIKQIQKNAHVTMSGGNNGISDFETILF